MYCGGSGDGALEEFKEPLGGMDSHAVEAEHYLR